jgi:ribosome recycling factor
MAILTFSPLKVFHGNEDAVQSYQDSIRTLENHINGEDTGLVAEDWGGKFRIFRPMTRDEARESLVRELRRYAEFMEHQVCYND